MKGFAFAGRFAGSVGGFGVALLLAQACASERTALEPENEAGGSSSSAGSPAKAGSGGKPGSFGGSGSAGSASGGKSSAAGGGGGEDDGGETASAGAGDLGGSPA